MSRFTIVTILSIFAALSVPPLSLAQSINPTVQVTNTYEGHLMDIQKITPPVAVPDSVMRFDWNFDYSVFENPYKGAYEFSPYLIAFRPEERVSGGQTFYLNAGAGYGLHPELTAVWSPKLRKTPLMLTLYEEFRGYFGNYHTFKDAGSEDGFYSPAPDTCARGSDLQNRVGASARYLNSDVALSLDLGYDMVAVGGLDFPAASLYPALAGGGFAVNTGCFDVTAEARSMKEGPFGIGGVVSFRAASQSSHGRHAEDVFKPVSFRDNNLSVSVSGDYRSGDFRYSLGLETETGRVPAGNVQHYFSFRARPGVDWSRERLHASASLGVNLRSGALSAGQLLYPSVRADYVLVPELLTVFGGYKSGSRIATMMDIAGQFHFLQTFAPALVDEESERMNVFLGARGRIGSRFQYSVDGGYCRYGNKILDGFRLLSSEPEYGSKPVYLPGFEPLLERVDYDAFYADARLDWESERVSARAAVRYQYCSSEIQPQDRKGCLLPAALSGDASFSYNWNKRIYAGVSLEGQSRRMFIQDGTKTGLESSRLPGWVDLGLNAEFKATGKFSVWARGGNLLGQAIHRNVLYAEKGAYFTLGICLNF